MAEALVTRRDLAGLDPVLHDAVVCRDGAYVLQLRPGLEVPLFNNGTAVSSFVTGWQPGLILTIFAPVLLLEFIHEGGRGSFWLIDTEGRFIGNDFEQLPPHLFESVRRRAVPAISWFLEASTHGRFDEAPPSVTALLACHPDTRAKLTRLVLGPDDTRAISHVMPELPGDASSSWASLWRHPAELRVMQGEHVLEPGPGWHIERAQTLFAPVVILELVHVDGHQGVWYVDRSANYLGNGAAQLQGELRDRLAAGCSVLFADLWDQVIIAPTLPPGPDVQALFQLARSTRIDLLKFHLLITGRDVQPALSWHLGQTLPPSMHYTVPTGSGFVVLDPVHVIRTCHQFLRGELFRSVESGLMSWPSPVDGRDVLIVPRTLYIDDLNFAYQVHDERYALTFYVFATEQFFRTFALYFPSADLVVAADAFSLARVKYPCEQAGNVLLHHVAEFGPELVPALLQGPTETIHAFRGRGAMQLGHFVWQDLSGLSYLVDAFPREKLPRFFVFDSDHHPELYGPIDEIFPELAGKVVRLADSFTATIPTLYRDRQHVIKSTGISVPAQVGTRVVGALRRSVRWAAPVAEAARAHASGPVVLLGLRIGNRTVDDMEGFATRLIQMLVELLGSLTVVIDGHNSAGDVPGATYASFGDTLAGGSTFLQRENAIAASLTRMFRNSAATIVDNIGRPIAESVIWCSEADFFVAPWGAALAKYRWICNTPGLATTGRWNLEHRGDLSIYHNPAALENPTPMEFNAIEAVEDLVEGGDTDEYRDRCNYRLDETKVLAQISAIAIRVCRKRPDGLPVAQAASLGMTARRQPQAKLQLVDGVP